MSQENRIGTGRGRPRSPTPPSPPGAAAAASSGLSRAMKPPSLSSAMSKLVIDPSVQPMKRPGFGTEGTKLELETNFFKLNPMLKNLILYRYEISITKPSQSGRGHGRIMTNSKDTPYDSEIARQESYATMRRCFDQNPNVFKLPTGIAYDRCKTLFSLEKLNLPHDKFEWRESIEGRIINVVSVTPSIEGRGVVRFEDVIAEMKRAFEDTTADRVIAQLFDIVTNQQPYDEFTKAANKDDVYGPYSRQFYKRLNPPVDIGSGREARDGYFKSVRMVKGDPKDEPIMCLNVESKKAPFFKTQSLITTVQETLRSNITPAKSLTSEECRKLTHHLRDVKVITSHTGKDYTIESIAVDTPGRLIFKGDDGNQTNVQEYFKKRYNVDLQYPNLPCVRVRVGTNVVNFPMEFLEILPRQKVDLKKSTPEQSKQMIRLSAVPPTKRREEILNKVNHCGAGPNDPYAKQFGIEKETKMMRVTGRKLNPPQLLDQRRPGGYKIQVSGGEWDVKQSRVHRSATINKWVAVSCLQNAAAVADQLMRFLDALADRCIRMGIQLPRKPIDIKAFNDPKEFEGYFKICKEQEVDFAVCFIEENSGWIRNLLKYHADSQNDIITSCVRRPTVLNKGGDDATLINIALKINVKNGGINFGLEEQSPLVKEYIGESSGVMYIGFDVNHPPPLSVRERRQGITPKEPSIVGAVANTSGGVEKFSGQFYLQTQRQEEIESSVMFKCIEKFVEMFRTSTGANPTKVVVFRDGVSESQLRMVLHNETYALHHALVRACGNDVPTITMIVCQKRHNTRFFPMNMNANAKPAMQNIPAGTVVDTGPVSASLFDFYLASHTGIQGTTKATKYIVLRDDNHFTADALQRLTYVLAHVYQRCNKSVSLPAPAYFAHHVATRGKELYNGCARGGREDTSSWMSAGGSDEVMDFEEIQELIQREANVRTMGKPTWL